MTEAPIPMETSVAVTIAARLMKSVSPEEARALEVLIRHAKRNRLTSVSNADTLAELLKVRENIERALSLLTDAVNRFATPPGGISSP